MAKMYTLSTDVPGDEGENVQTISFRITGVDGYTYQITLDASEDVAQRINEGLTAAVEVYAKAVQKNLKWLLDLGKDENCAVKVTQVKASEPKAEGSYNGDRAVNKAIRDWHNAQPGAEPLSNRGRINDEVKAKFWTAVADGKVPDPRGGAENGSEGEQEATEE